MGSRTTRAARDGDSQGRAQEDGLGFGMWGVGMLIPVKISLLKCDMSSASTSPLFCVPSLLLRLIKLPIKSCPKPGAFVFNWPLIFCEENND